VKSRDLKVNTRAREEIVIITQQVQNALREMTDGGGILTLYTPHTTSALTINENADPDVPADLLRAIRAMIPDVRFDHGEGNSDSHLMSALIGCSITIPYRGGRLLLGRWQGIYFVELDGPRTREVSLHLIESA
jgi:secondary thiamine-phosphate synthase enzyme